MPRTLDVAPHHVALLQALHTYRLLSQPMMRQVGVARDRGIISEAARLLVRKNLAARTTAPLVSGVRRLPHLYWLTHKGAASLNSFLGWTGDNAAIGAKRRFGHMNEVMHRVGIVELHIACRAWCHAAGVELIRFITDFEPGSRGRQKMTLIEGKGWRFTPDALAEIKLPGRSRAELLIFELERGGEAGDLHPFFKHKLPHIQTLADGEYIENRHALGGAARFLIVFGSHDQSAAKIPLADKALARWPDTTEPVWDRFFVKSQDEITAGFGDGWRQPGTAVTRPLFKSLCGIGSL